MAEAVVGSCGSAGGAAFSLVSDMAGESVEERRKKLCCRTRLGETWEEDGLEEHPGRAFYCVRLLWTSGREDECSNAGCGG